MLRRYCPFILIAISLALTTGDAYGQDLENVSPWIGPSLIAQSDTAQQYISNNPGAYLSWVKLLVVAVVFILWVRLTDWINRDSMKIGERTGLMPEAWNPISVGAFLVGFLVVLFVPLFWAGLPVYLISAFTPFILYFFMRRSKIKLAPEIVQALSSKPGEAPGPPPLPQDLGAQIDFVPAGDGKQQKQVNLIRARQSVGFSVLKDLIVNAISKRTDTILLDYTRDKTTCRIQVDGVWHPLPPMDRATGDALLVSLKSLAGLKPEERRGKQTGSFSLKSEGHKATIELLTAGVPTGERVQASFKQKLSAPMTLGQLGMFPDMVEKIKLSLNHTGMTIISAPPGGGLTSSWQGALTTADRLTRDCVAILETDETDTTVENIILKRYDSAPGKQFETVKATLLSQPDFVAVPTVSNAEVMDYLTLQVTDFERSLLLRTPAKSAAEALLKTYAKSENRDQFVQAAKYVTCQRMVRRLCDACKQPARVPPKTIQQLGGDPKEQTTLYNQYRLPPPEQRVDEKGNPIEFPPCPVCGGIGYIGRVGVFEMIEVNESVGRALKTTPKVESIEQAAQKTGKKTIAQQAYKLVLLGVTSIAEVQRVLKES